MSATVQSLVREMLRQGGLYYTLGRAAILSILLAADKPLTRRQITSRLGKKGLNKVTIYRALDSFIQAGLVHRAFLHNRTWHFELAHHCTQTQCHPHFTCNICGDTRCLAELSVPMIRGLKKGFVAHRQRIELEGLCPKCSPLP